MNDDRISELYLGEGTFATSASRDPNRLRIDWIVSQAKGRVLDIGASQGIVSILLGRLDHDVIGVEIEEPAIAYARKALAAEPADVRRRVKFLHADIYGKELANQQFDTVILGEILEHHAEPRKLWLRAAEFAGPNGKIVGTTPFGLHPHPDHRVTFYLRLFIETIKGVGTLTHLDLDGGFIRFIVDKSPNAKAVATDDAALLALSEQGFLAIQEKVELLKEDYNSRGERIRAANEKVKSLGQKAEQLNSELAAKKTELAAQAAELRTLREMRDRLVKLESYMQPPDGASPGARRFSALLSSLLREINTGGLRESPIDALRKTYARVRKASNHEHGE